jgi:hypothetical protein
MGRIRDALATMPEQDAAAVTVLLDTHDNGMYAVAAQLGINKNAAEYHYNRGMTRLLEFLRAGDDVPRARRPVPLGALEQPAVNPSPAGRC